MDSLDGFCIRKNSKFSKNKIRVKRTLGEISALGPFLEKPVNFIGTRKTPSYVVHSGKCPKCNIIYEEPWEHGGNVPIPITINGKPYNGTQHLSFTLCGNKSCPTCSPRNGRRYDGSACDGTTSYFQICIYKRQLESHTVRWYDSRLLVDTLFSETRHQCLKCFVYECEH